MKPNTITMTVKKGPAMQALEDRIERLVKDLKDGLGDVQELASKLEYQIEAPFEPDDLAAQIRDAILATQISDAVIERLRLARRC